MAQSISPNQEELHLLAEAIGLEYPPNPKQINKAALVLSYLLGKGMIPVLNFIDSIPQREFYIDAFAKEIYLLRFSETISVYTKSDPIQIPVIPGLRERSRAINYDKQGNEVSLVRDNVVDPLTDQLRGENKELTTEEIEYNLGADPKKDIIEYKIRKELLALIKANPQGIDKLEQMYDARDERTPFSWFRQIKVGYFNVLWGGKDRTGYDNMKDNLNNKLNLATEIIDRLPADTSKDSLNKGSVK